VPFTGEVVNQPLLSPDGSKYLWWYPGPDGFGGLNAVWVRRLTVGAPQTEGVGFCSYCVISHGWLGETAIGGLPADSQRPSRICTLASPAEAPNVSGTCVQQLVAEARGGLGFPNGNAAGTEVVAVLTPGERTGVRGRLVRYAVPSGTLLGDVTPGPGDTTPVFSPEGDRIAFERDGQIVVKELDGGAEKPLGAGVYPHWGGERTTVGAAVRSRSLRYRRGRIAVRVACTGTETCRGRLRISKGSRTLGSRNYRVRAGRSATVAVKPSRRGRRTIQARRSHTVRVQLKPSTGDTVTRSLRLRR